MTFSEGAGYKDVRQLEVADVHHRYLVPGQQKLEHHNWIIGVDVSICDSLLLRLLFMLYFNISLYFCNVVIYLYFGII